ncbi:hypothetical protein CY34DRAFT_798396 [Suillus luteus UH-Slu-Lm8-n1]|uniref:Uncharacterized protein n=1 Tax=Suillus luteus UH-Slu-Lm8-n1 TaxID=930992 RepID=A0A0D0BZX1_9AGAM|nr:hypothetical protein CY34DRAFT_798396 [Suillus luteus UH-Slu-Lm8-n1]
MSKDMGEGEPFWTTAPSSVNRQMKVKCNNRLSRRSLTVRRCCRYLIRPSENPIHNIVL